MAEAEHCSIFITRYRAALFDMDGVIMDTMPLHLKAWQEAFRPWGVDVSRMDLYIREGLQSPTMAREIARAKGKSFSGEDLGKIVAAKGELFDREAPACARAFDGAAETLRMLRNHGLKTALVTGSRGISARKVLAAAGVLTLFDVIVTGDDTEKGKPDPDPYLKAIEKTRVNPLDCVVIENAPMGIKAAKAAGVDYVIAVTTSLGREYLKEADDIMDSIADLEVCLARRFAAHPPI
ncbi:MAG TPA: HAD family phosphatase [Methanocella sp.]|nr:HAD family phosphatase [Methanocella sp.]